MRKEKHFPHKFSYRVGFMNSARKARSNYYLLYRYSLNLFYVATFAAHNASEGKKTVNLKFQLVECDRRRKKVELKKNIKRNKSLYDSRH